MAGIGSRLALALMLVACGAPADVAPPSQEAAPIVEPEPEPEPEGREERAAYVHSAQRCGECHEAAFTGWEGSSHARSAVAPAFVAMRARVPDHASECARCHEPLAAWVPAGDSIAAEGVACDACHAAAGVVEVDGLRQLDIRLDDNVKYGPLADAEDHYFHRMGHSPLHATAGFCAPCHDLTRTAGGVELPIYSEHREWSEGPYAEEGNDCQLCHMPSSRGSVATGSPERDLSHHGFFGSSGDLRSRALEMTLTATGAGERVELVVSLRNRRAGHRVPSGMPGRRIIVRARAVSADGEELARAEHSLARVLVDAEGHEAPHHEAVRMLSDERIAPRETLAVPLSLEVPAAGEIVVELSWREMSDELAAAVGIDAPREQALAEAHVSLGPPAARRRLGRPRITVIAPSPEGDEP